MACNPGREDRKACIYKEKEEKILLEYGVEHETSEQIRSGDRPDFTSNWRLSRGGSDFGEFLAVMADREKQADVRLISQYRTSRERNSNLAFINR